MCVPVSRSRRDYEADDVIGTLSQKAAAEAGYEVYHGDARQGLRAARARLLPASTSSGAPRAASRSSTARPSATQYGIRRPDSWCATSLRCGAMPRTIFPASRASARRVACKLVRDVGNGAKTFWRMSSKIPGQAGREDRRVGRQPAAGQAPDDHLPRRADPFPRGGPHGLRPAYRPAARALRRTGFQGFYERSDEPRTRSSRFPKVRVRRRRPSWRRWPAPSRPRRRRPRWRDRAICSATPSMPLPAAQEVPVAELQAEAEAMQFRTRRADDAPRIHARGDAPRNCARWSPRSADTPNSVSTPRPRVSTSSTTASSGMSLAVEPFKAWYVPFLEKDTPEYAEIVRPLFEDENDRQDRAEHQVRPDGAAPAGHHDPGPACTTR